MSKGLAGVLPLAVAAIALAVIPGFSAARLGAMGWVITGAALAAGPWYIYEGLFNYPAFLSSFVGYETLRRVTSHLEDDQIGSEFPLLTFVSELRHLWPLLLPLIALSIGRVREGLMATWRRTPSEIELWLVWLAVTLAAACAVQTRLPWYVLPALIPAALLIAAIPAYALRGGGVRTLAGVLAVVALVIIGLDTPRRWRAISWTADHQRALSLPSYLLAMKARSANPTARAGSCILPALHCPRWFITAGRDAPLSRPRNWRMWNWWAPRTCPRRFAFTTWCCWNPPGTPK